MKKYSVHYSAPAAKEIGNTRQVKAARKGKVWAIEWGKQLKREIREDLCFMPEKYQVRRIKDHPEIVARAAFYDKKRVTVVYVINEEACAVEILHALPSSSDILE